MASVVGIPSQIASMSPAQFASLPPHLKLNHTKEMPNQFYMNTAVLNPRQAQSVGLGTGAGGPATRLFQPIRSRVVQPNIIPKRPLNSWMGFRVFYSPIFSSLEQKNVSGHLTALWSRDPFKAKWTIATRAYSSIRDLVGKPLAPVDKFLAIVCPELGIIDPSLYLEMMCWEIEYDLNGQIVGLLQTAVPDVAAFDDYIKYTAMNENDVIHFCAYMGYISQHAANIIAGDPAQQQTLLATAPAAIAPAPAPVIAAPIINPFLADTVNDPRAAATQVLGFDVDEVLGPAEQSETPGAGGLLLSPAAAPAPKPYEWTGCMADLYNPDEGTFNFEDMVRDQCDGDVGDISDPASFDEMFGDVLEGGFMQPSVSEEYGDAGDFF